MKTKFYTYSQNNSGGGFDVDEKAGICEYVIIEATSPDDADSRAENIGLYFDGCGDGRDCSCCGDRWGRAWDDGDDVPSVYGQPVESTTKSWFRERAFVHYIDGTFKEFKFS